MGRLFSKRRDLKPAQPKKNQGNSEAPFPAAQKRPNLEVEDQKSPKADKSFASLFKGCGMWGGAPQPYPGEAEKKNQGNSEAPFPAAQKVPNPEGQDSQLIENTMFL